MPVKPLPNLSITAKAQNYKQPKELAKMLKVFFQNGIEFVVARKILSPPGEDYPAFLLWPERIEILTPAYRALALHPGRVLQISIYAVRID